MALVRIPVAGTVGKAIRINTDATVGGKIGTDIKLPDGSTPTFRELAIALNRQLPPLPTTSAAPIATPTGTVFESQIVDGNILARVAANEIISGAYNFTQNITALSYDGVLAANLLDKTVNEIVTGRWDFESDGSAPQLCIVDSDSNGAATRAFIEYLGKGDVLTGRMGYLTATSGIFTIDNALPNAGIELTNAGVQKLRIDINGVFMSDDTDVSGALTATSYGGILEANLLDKTAAETISGIWNFTNELSFGDDANLTFGDANDGQVGFNSGLNEMQMLSIGTTNVVIRVNAIESALIARPNAGVSLHFNSGEKIITTLVGVLVTGDVDATTFAGIPKADLLDRNAAETINGIWNFANELSFGDDANLTFGDGNDGQIGFNSALNEMQVLSIGTTNVVIKVNAIETALIAVPNAGVSLHFNSGQKIITTIGGVLVTGDIDATTYGGIAKANLLDRNAAETINGIWNFTNELSFGDDANLTFGDANDGSIGFNSAFDEMQLFSIGTTNVVIKVNAIENALIARPNAGVSLHFNSGEKIITTIGGVLVTGEVDATTYGGVAKANLLDKSAVETISNDWVWDTSATTITFTGNGGPFGVQFRSVGSTTAQQIDLVYRTTPKTLAFERTSDAVKIIDMNAADLSVAFAGALTATSYDGILAANLLDKTAAETISGKYDFTANLEIAGSVPQFFINESDETLDNKFWVQVAAGKLLRFGAENDAHTVTINWMTVARTGTVVDTIALTAAAIQINGALTATSYDGVLAANLLDKTAAETITGLYTIAGTLTAANATLGMKLRAGNTGVVFAGDQVHMGFNGADRFRQAIGTRHDSLNDINNAIEFYVWQFGQVDTDVPTFRVLNLNSVTSELVSNLIISGQLITDDSTTVRSGFRILPGVEPTSPVDGDVWTTTADIFARVNGVNEPLTGAGGVGIARISGSSGAAGVNITWQKRTTDFNKINNTLGVAMSTTSVGAGTWKFKYTIIYQSSNLATGVQFAVAHTGTVTDFSVRWSHITSGVTGATAIGDNFTGVSGGALMEGMAGDTAGSRIGTASSGVQLVNSNILAVVEGIIVVSATGTLQLQFANETGTSQVKLKAASCLELMKIA